MSEPTYSMFVLVPSGQSPTLDAAQAALDLYFADKRRKSLGVKVSRQGTWVMVSFRDFPFYVALVEGDGIAEESGFIASRIGGDVARRERIAACRIRFEVWSKRGDASSDHFNDWIDIASVMENLVPGAILYDVQGGRLM